MFRIKYTLSPSDVDGIGLFADQAIKKGDTVYEVIVEDDFLFTEGEFETLAESRKTFIKHYGYFDKKLISGIWPMTISNTAIILLNRMSHWLIQSILRPVISSPEKKFSITMKR